MNYVYFSSILPITIEPFEVIVFPPRNVTELFEDAAESLDDVPILLQLNIFTHKWDLLFNSKEIPTAIYLFVRQSVIRVFSKNRHCLVRGEKSLLFHKLMGMSSEGVLPIFVEEPPFRWSIKNKVPLTTWYLARHCITHWTDGSHLFS